MAFDQRPPTPLDPDTDPNLPIADSSQAHDIPTGVAPSLAKLQDWIAWMRANGLFNPLDDVDINGALHLVGGGSSLEVDGIATFNQFVALFGTVPSPTVDSGDNVFHAGHIPKVWGRIYTDGVGGATREDGIHLGALTVTATHVDVAFADVLSNSNYSVVATNVTNNTHVACVDFSNSTDAKVRLVMRDMAAAGAVVDPSATVCRWSFCIMGRA
jgi:hypothetical protein